MSDRIRLSYCAGRKSEQFSRPLLTDPVYCIRVALIFIFIFHVNTPQVDVILTAPVIHLEQ